jgi:hypothetical protein
LHWGREAREGLPPEPLLQFLTRKKWSLQGLLCCPPDRRDAGSGSYWAYFQNGKKGAAFWMVNNLLPVTIALELLKAAGWEPVPATLNSRVDVSYFRYRGQGEPANVVLTDRWGKTFLGGNHPYVIAEQLLEPIPEPV